VANYIHKSSVIGAMASIELSSRGTDTHIGENCHIDDFVKIKHVGGTADIKIGSHVYVNSGTVIYSGNGVQIGNSVLIGPNCCLVPSNHNVEDSEKLIREQGFSDSRGGIVIEDDVWLGANVTVLDGSVIRKGAVIGANSLVNHEVAEYTINVGNPAKEIGRRK